MNYDLNILLHTTAATLAEAEALIVSLIQDKIADAAAHIDDELVALRHAKGLLSTLRQYEVRYALDIANGTMEKRASSPASHGAK